MLANLGLAVCSCRKDRDSEIAREERENRDERTKREIASMILMSASGRGDPSRDHNDESTL